MGLPPSVVTCTLILVIAEFSLTSMVFRSSCQTDKAAKPEKVAPAEKKAPKKAAKKKLTGADLYAVHCGRCHPERYATEFTAAQWKTVMIEMRVRANLA